MKINLLLILLLSFISFVPKGMTQCGTDSTQVTINIRTDQYAVETYWELINLTDTIDLVEEGGLENNQLYIWSYCVSDDDCTSFTIYDEYGDGLSLPGFYNIMLDGQEVAFGTAFGNVETTTLICGTGQSCLTASTVQLDSIYHTFYNNDFYKFIADTIGVFSISTCELNNCDTKIWVYGDCPAANPPNDNTGTIFYDDNEGGCNLQAKVNALLNVDSEIYIRIGTADGDCTENINWQITYEGPVAGCTDPSSCNYNAVATLDDGSCLPPDHPECPEGPDLELQEDVLRNTLYLDQEFAEANSCLTNEGCLRGYGTRDIIRFATHFKNIGEFDYYVGEESEDNELFSYDNCHAHYHYESYAEYLLVDSFSNIIPIGHKAGFCVTDLECSGGGFQKYSCENMGISAGCGDVYSAGLNCQWIDVTEVPDGAYTIVARVNWLNQPDFNGQVETRTDNNWATACVILSRSSGILEMEIAPDCAPYTDCAGVPFGLAVIDCEGNCGGPALRGDLDNNAAQDIADVETYITDILGHDIDPAACNDLNGDGQISVYDAALMNDCVNYANGHIHTGGVAHEHCDFPTGIFNPNDTIILNILTHNPAESYIDIGITNSTASVVGYEFSLSGVMMTSVESLTDATTEPFTVRGNFTGDIIGLSYPDSSLQKTLEPQPLCRVYYSTITETEICISEIRDIVNSDYEQTVPVVGGVCILLTSTKEFTNNLEISVQPNPFFSETELVIQYPNDIEFELNILNVNGRLVQTYGKVRPGSVMIKRGDLAPGIYFFELTSGGARKVGRLSVF